MSLVIYGNECKGYNLKDSICDRSWENVPTVTKTTIEIQLKVGSNSIFLILYHSFTFLCHLDGKNGG